jgi:hypothetical protein
MVGARVVEVFMSRAKGRDRQRPVSDIEGVVRECAREDGSSKQ